MLNVCPRNDPALDKAYFPPYGEHDINFLKEEAKKIIGWIWKDNDNPVLRKEIVTDFRSVLEIIDLVERRRIYYHIFHKGMDMNESKEIALYCYWILKLQPFLRFKKDSKFPSKKGIEVNAIIAYRLLLNTANALNKHFTLGTLKSLMHSFRYHDISKEALIALCETLFDEQINP